MVAHYLKHHCNYTGRVYLIGMSGFAQEMEDMGISCVGVGVSVCVCVCVCVCARARYALVMLDTNAA